MNALQFIYQESEIHFLINPTDKHVMVNATEMAKIFGKDTRDYLDNKSTKAYIKELGIQYKASERGLISPRSDVKIIDRRGHMGTYFHRTLALDFAAWLDVKFRVWVFNTLDEIVFGNYKAHWQAHVQQEAARQEMESIKQEILISPTPEVVAQYFEQERLFKAAKQAKTTAIRTQLRLFGSPE